MRATIVSPIGPPLVPSEFHAAGSSDGNVVLTVLFLERVFELRLDGRLDVVCHELFMSRYTRSYREAGMSDIESLVCCAPHLLHGMARGGCDRPV